MKKVLLLIAVFYGFTIPTHLTTRDDKSVLITQLQQTKARLLKDLEGLTDAQLEYKPAADRWSVIECVEHIVLTEKMFMENGQKVLQTPANPEKRAEIKVTDEAILKNIEDRSRKFKAPEVVSPKRTFTSNAATINAFTTQRDQLIDYVTNTSDDLRNHVTQHPALGYIDVYQLLLLDAAHTARHTLQVEEVKADPGFPKSATVLQQ
ncbi:DinB family protein [Chitinophaga nivalis]|uniref:DinB family protein n=1 Tax=Chitinophaga nivalis TaxID=2991709 RepID=A0ABT3IS37_9BACT|nr:DinB family protein [Chitinophaga nivalis]MCW3463599.1 DinB family protein [Chitinophaga nivalis]MCW3486711.1 DinB family protein [Chitinophaga nivalis]